MNFLKNNWLILILLVIAVIGVGLLMDWNSWHDKGLYMCSGTIGGMVAFLVINNWSKKDKKE
jgi:hypothetical protein